LIAAAKRSLPLRRVFNGDVLAADPQVLLSFS
jgi:hypothetical protein